MGTNPRRRQYPKAKADNVMREEARGTQLTCGHVTKQHPLVSSPTKRWWCDECSKLVGVARPH